MNPAMNMMPMMGGMPMMNPMMGGMMMGNMTCKMTDDGMTCEIMPMEGMDKDMFMECCKRMMAMVSGGAPVMMNCGGMMICCTMAA